MIKLLYLNIFLCLIPSYVVYCNINDEYPVVKIETGFLRGKYLESRSGKRIYSFTSIPFAEPPVGKLRFEVSRMLLRLNKINDVTYVCK